MKLKVCGMRSPDNIDELVKLAPDFIGFIFYPRSRRYVGADFQMPAIPEAIKKVGVFVNEDIDRMAELIRRHELHFVQLHGNESINTVKALNKLEVGIIKVFSVAHSLPMQDLALFEPYVDYFLFDTKTDEYGGSGKKFNWDVLEQYSLNKPFFLSGGIGVDDIPQILNLNLTKLEVVDVNSRFELAPAVKNIEELALVKEQL